jgi:DNA-binding XRE family transcriptional regulator
MFLGVDQSTVHLWEVGKTNPRAALLPKIAQLYHCTVDDLLRKE